MKKYLLSLILMCAVFIGQAQRDLWFNEIYPNPGSNNSEYFELFNTSTTAIPLDCYIVVSYYNTGSQRGVYVYNFPTGATINPFSHYVVASSQPVNYQKTSWTGSNLSNWNGTLNGGYIQQYQLNASGQWPTQGTAVPNNFRDFMYITNGNDASVNMLLYRINANGTATLVNSVFGSGNGTIPTAVTSLPALTVTAGSATCAPSATTPVSLSFGGITFNNTETFNIGNATGSDNGYARYGDATCGGWDKFTGNTNTLFTPGAPNPLGGTRTPILTSTTEKIVCGASIQIQVISPTSSTSYPVEARLYIDVNKDGRLDGTDTYLESITINSGSATVYSFNHVYNSSNNYLVVYRTSLGCFDRVMVPTVSTGTITTQEFNVCGNQIDFSVTGVSGDGALYGLPLTVQLYENNGDVTFDPAVDVPFGNPVTVTSVSATTRSITIPEENKGKQYILVYTSANSCYSKAVVPPAAQGSINTTQLSICDNQVNFSITGATGYAATSTAFVFPATVNIYNDLNNDGDLDDENENVATASIVINSFSSIQTLTNPNPGSKMYIQYTTAQSCFSPALITPTQAAGGLTTTTTSICGNQVDFTITAATGDATASASYVFPITVNLYYDVNGDGDLDDDERVPVGDPVIINSFASTVHTIINPDPSKSLYLGYQTAQSCFSTTQLATLATGTVATTENYVCNNTLSYTVSGGTTNDATTYSLPIDIMVYNVANNELLGSKRITTFSNTSDTIQLQPADWENTTVRVEYVSANTCFNKTVPGATKTTTGTITVSGSIAYSTPNGVSTSTLTYFVVPAATAADVYPLELVVYEDFNRNDKIDVGEPIIATQQVNTAPAQGTTYTVTLQQYKSSAVILARCTVGCSETLEAITNVNAPLPVKLVSFTAKRNKEKVHLAWETSMETNNSGFDIQRKLGNGEWKTIAFMFSKAMDGNSNTALTYEYTDVNPTKGVSQYRLRQVDIDTRYEFSEIRSVRGEEQASQLLIYPNPSSNGKVNLVFDEQSGSRNVTVSDVTGRIVKQYQNINNSSLQIDNLENGMYTIQITNMNSGETTVSKVIIKKR